MPAALLDINGNAIAEAGEATLALEQVRDAGAWPARFGMGFRVRERVDSFSVNLGSAAVLKSLPVGASITVTDVASVLTRKAQHDGIPSFECVSAPVLTTRVEVLRARGEIDFGAQTIDADFGREYAVT